MDIDLTIRGLQEAQTKNRERIAMLQPADEFGEVIQRITAFAHKQAVSVTHVDTGALRASHRMKISGARGNVFIDPTATNPRTSEKPAEYGVTEHERGGSHAFYSRAAKATDKYAASQVQQFARGLVR